jgi:nucleotide-binding universal stress UspA family protein
VKVNTILSVLSATETDWSLDNQVVARSVRLAQQFEAEIVLLQIAYDNSLGHGTFVPRAEIDSARLTLLASYREHLEALRETLVQGRNLDVRTDVRWSHDFADCILQAASKHGADLILKQPQDRSFVLGLLPNSDWDLLRDSAVPVWFVAAEAVAGPSQGIIAAVDQAFSDDDDEGEEDEKFALDNRAFEAAETLSRCFGAPLYAVHAYQIPRSLPGFEGYAPLFPPAPGLAPEASAAAAQSTETREQARRDLAARHGKLVRDFVTEHGIPLDDLVVQEGPVDQVLTSTAESRHAGLIVMGAAHKTWWDRLRGHVSAEPTLADAPCDVLFVKT